MGSIPIKVVPNTLDVEAVNLEQGRTARCQIRRISDVTHAHVLSRFTPT